MSDSRLFGYTSRMISRALDVSARRHNLITGNIANMDTIGFTPSDLDFQDTLMRAMAGPEPDYLEKTHPDHLAGVENKTDPMNGDDSEEVDIFHLDSVNIDTEMMHLMENNTKYKTVVELKLRKSNIMNYAIDEGGK
jgi:flagellar basal-body rod protein FlgB